MQQAKHIKGGALRGKKKAGKDGPVTKDFSKWRMLTLGPGLKVGKCTCGIQSPRQARKIRII